MICRIPGPIGISPGGSAEVVAVEHVEHGDVGGAGPIGISPAITEADNSEQRTAQQSSLFMLGDPLSVLNPYI